MLSNGVSLPGLAAEWLLPCCDKDAQIVPGEVHRIQQFTGLSAGWLLSLCEKGEQFLVAKLATFDYTSYLLNLLTVVLTFFTCSAKVQVPQFLLSANCFTRFAKVHRLSLPTSPFCPIDPPSWLPFAFVWGIVLVFCQLLVSFFCPMTGHKEHWHNKHIPIEEILNAFAKARSNQRVQRASNPRSTVPIFHIPPSPFSMLHRSYF